eukprot:4006077-Pyramimonas_sp.AAC.1
MRLGGAALPWTGPWGCPTTPRLGSADAAARTGVRRVFFTEFYADVGPPYDGATLARQAIA